MRTLSLISLPFLVCLGGTAHAQDACTPAGLIPVGSEFRINAPHDFPGSSQHRDVALVAEKAGGFLAGWTTAHSFPVFHGRHFSVDGIATSLDMDLMEFPFGNVHKIYGRPALVSRLDHEFQAMWAGYFQVQTGPTSYASREGIVTRQYLGDGTRVTDYTPAAVEIGAGQTYPAAAETNSDNFVGVWSGAGDGDNNGVFLRQFLSNGMPVGDEFRVNGTVADGQFQPRVASRAGGGYVVVWRGNGPGDSQGIFMRGFDPFGVPLSGDVRVNTTTAETQYAPDIAMGSNGRFVVVWAGYDGNGDPVVQAQRFDRNRARVGGEILVNPQVGEWQSAPAVAMMPDGGFVVASNGSGPGDSDGGVFLRRYDEFGQTHAELLRVNTTVADSQRAAAIAVAPGGEIMVAWQGNGFAGDLQIYGQVYARPARMYRGGFESPDGPCPY